MVDVPRTPLARTALGARLDDRLDVVGRRLVMVVAGCGALLARQPLSARARPFRAVLRGTVFGGETPRRAAQTVRSRATRLVASESPGPLFLPIGTHHGRVFRHRFGHPVSSVACRAAPVLRSEHRRISSDSRHALPQRCCCWRACGRVDRIVDGGGVSLTEQREPGWRKDQTQNQHQVELGARMRRVDRESDPEPLMHEKIVVGGVVIDHP